MDARTFSFIASLNPFASIIFTSVSLGKSAADDNEGVSATASANQYWSCMAFEGGVQGCLDMYTEAECKQRSSWNVDERCGLIGSVSGAWGINPVQADVAKPQ